MTARSETITLIARQVATFNGVSYSMLATKPALAKRKASFDTLAESILATVERRLRAEDNCILDHLQDWI